MADISAALPTFVITLREGVEAALVVGIVLACLQKAQQSRLNPWVYGGIGAGLVGSALTGLLLRWGFGRIQLLEPAQAAVIEPLLKAGLCGVAIAMLSWMLIWMTRQAKSLKAEIEGSITATLSQGSAAKGSAAGWGVFGLVAIAVLREGFETVVFILANLQQGWAATVGALGGLLGAVAIGFGLFRFGIQIDIRRFFQVMGLLLLLIVAGLTTSLLKSGNGAVVALGQLQGLDLCVSQASCILGPLVWDLSGWLPDRAFPGVVLKALLGYRDRLFLVQAIVYLGFLGAVGTLYFRSLGSGKTKVVSST